MGVYVNTKSTSKNLGEKVRAKVHTEEGSYGREV